MECSGGYPGPSWPTAVVRPEHLILHATANGAANGVSIDIESHF